MMKKAYTYCFFSFAFLWLIAANVNAQDRSILDFNVKELTGDTIELRSRLDPNSNYIIETMAFWCNPCIKSIDKFTYHKNYWKERFNVDILILEDEHWNDIPYVVDKIESYNWDVDFVLSNDQYGSAGITSIPTYFFKGVASDTVERVYGNIEKFLIERLDSIKFIPILDEDFKQGMLSEECDEVVLKKYNALKDTIIGETKYHVYNNIPFRENNQNGDIIRFNNVLEKEELYIKFSAALCSRIWIKDSDNDSLLIKILDRYQVDSVLHIVTDQFIQNECGVEDIPFEFIQNIGSNAGLFFDIEQGKISSRLICHEQTDEFIYTDPELGSLCQTLSSKNLPQKMDVQVYPNPVNSTLFVNMNFNGEKKINIFTPSGQLVVSRFTKDKKIEIKLSDQLKSTLLMVKVSSNMGTLTQKVLKVGN